MKDEKSNGQRNGEGAAAASDTYVCQGDLCRLIGTPGSGPAEKMFNLPCNPAKVSPEELLKRVRCRRCAERVAEENEKRLFEPGCGTYPLHRTLAQKTAAETLPKGPDFREIRQRADADYLSWVESRSRNREMAARHDRAAAYAREFLELGYGEYELCLMPNPVFVNGAHFCGLPREVGCCGRDKPVDRFLTICGEVVGICRAASEAFLDVQRAHAADNRAKRLLWTADLAKAEAIARKWSDEEK